MLDDEESAVVTAGAIVTVTVTLTRNSMSSVLTGESLSSKTTSETADVEADDRVEEEKENTGADSQVQTNQVYKVVANFKRLYSCIQ